MEKRKSERKILHGELDGGVISFESAELSNISMNGLCFKFLKKLDPNTKQKMAIKHDETVINMTGTVVRSRVANTRKIDGEDILVYEVGISFDSLPPEKVAILKKIFQQL